MTVDASLSGTLRFRPSSSCGSPSSLGLGPEPCRESSTAGALPCASDAELANATASLGFPGDPTESREPALEPANPPRTSCGNYCPSRPAVACNVQPPDPVLSRG